MSERSVPRSVIVLTGVLALAAAVIGLLATDFPLPSRGLGASPLLLVALVVAGVLPTVYTAGENGNTMDLFEAALTPAVLLLTGLGAVVLAAAAKLVSLLVLRMQPVKLAFNVAQWACVAAVASAVYHRFGNGSVRGLDMGVLAVAMAAGLVVNHLSVIEVVALASRRPFRAALDEFRPVMRHGWVIGSAVNLSFGLLFAALASSTPAAIPLVLVPLLTLFSANRSHAAVRADHVRLEGLQRATHELAAAVDPMEGFQAFLDIVRSHFECGEVELILLRDKTVQRSGDAAAPDSASFALAEVVAAVGAPVRMRAGQDSAFAQLVTAKGRRGCLAAPLKRGSEVVGVLATYDREGFDGFEEGETAVLEALAGEAASALARRDLLEQVISERARYIDIVARSFDGIFSVGPDGLVDSWNPAMEAITGRPADEMLGRTIAVLRPTGANGEVVTFERWMSDGALPATIRITTTAGADRWLGCSYSQPDARTSLVVTARDITRARELEQLKDDFVDIVSHELRTPLTTIRGFTQILEDGGLSEPERRESLGMIRKGVQRLDRLIVNLLEVSRIAPSSPATTVAVDVGAVCRRVVDEHRENNPNREIVLVADRPVFARGNETSLEQVVDNLVANALKYAPLGPVEVRVRYDGDSAEIAVRDEGPGIPRHEQQRIFERFERLDHATSRAGTGLGLYIARQLTMAMGGALSVESEEGKGATFVLRLVGEAPAVAGTDRHLKLVRDDLTA